MMPTPILQRCAIGVILAFATAASACGSDSTSESDQGTTDTDTAAEVDTSTGTADDATADVDVEVEGDADSTAGVAAAQWADNVTITMSDDSFQFESNGIPNHELADEYLVPTEGSFSVPVDESEVNATSSDVAVVESPVDETITLNPVYSDTITDTSLGIIGVAISGAQLFNDYEDLERSFVAVDDNFTVDGVSFVDSCNGHPLALNADGTGQGSYHYHGVPYCITDAVDVDGDHSTIIGVLLDGFPFYGPKGEGGTTITSDDLDECSGHVEATPEFPEGIYHYHLTEDRSPYTIDCYHGEIDAASTDGAGGPPDGEGPPAGD